MAFPGAAVRTPTSIGRIFHVLTDNPAGENTVRYVYEVLDQNGDVMERKQGDEAPHMTAGQISAVETFLSAQRSKAEATLP